MRRFKFFLQRQRYRFVKYQDFTHSWDFIITGRKW